MEEIAETALLCVYPDGEHVVVRVSIGRPFAHPRGDWACQVSAAGSRLWEGPITIFGVGSWDALMSSLRFLREMLRREEERGAVFHRPDEEQVISVEELFCLHEII